MHSPSTVASHRRGWRCARGRWLSAAAAAAAAALVDGGAPAHSTAHASDIISHVTLIFESSRYVDCIRSASASLPCNIPSFLPSVFFFANIQLPPSRATMHRPRGARALALFLSSPPSRLRLPPSRRTSLSARTLCFGITHFVN